jgi:glucokinase
MENIDRVIAIDWGHTNFRTALVTFLPKGYDIQDYREIPSSKISDDKALFNFLEDSFGTKILEEIKGFAISTAGAIDDKRKSVLLSSVPPSGYSTKTAVEKKYNKKVILINDANAGVYAEKRFGEYRKADNLVYITISSGIGAGVICNSILITGQNGAAGEVGRFVMNLPGLGNDQRSWESLASGNKLPITFGLWLAKNKIKIAKPAVTAEDLFRLQLEGSSDVIKFMDEIHRINAAAISNIIAAYNPEVIIFGGAVMLNNKSTLLAGIRKNLRTTLPVPKMVISELGETNCLLGAAVYFIENYNRIV